MKDSNVLAEIIANATQMADEKCFYIYFKGSVCTSIYKLYFFQQCDFVNLN